MKKLWALCLLWLWLWLAALAIPAVPLAAAPPGFITLAYPRLRLQPGEGPGGVLSIPLEELTDHFDWLHNNGYRVIGLDEILAARDGGPPLPPNAVLLTFDDPHISFYHAVYPLLRAYHYRAVLALDTALMETPPDKAVLYGDELRLHRSQFVTWGEVREMAADRLVEAASGGHQPQRVPPDWARSAAIITRRTGQAPRLAVWPQGRATEAGAKAALAAGYALSATRDIFSGGATLPRLQVTPGLNFTEALAEAEAGLRPGHSGYERLNFSAAYPAPFEPPLPLQRAAHVDLDLLYDPDPAQQERNLAALFERLAVLKPSAVYLRAYADQDRDGRAEALYFSSGHLPLRADLLGGLARRLSRQLGVAVYAVMPAAFAWPEGLEGPESSRILEIYEDLGSSVHIDGLYVQGGPDAAREVLDATRELIQPAGLSTVCRLDLPDMHGDEGAARLEGDLEKILAACDYAVLAVPLASSRKVLEAAAQVVKKIPWGNRRAIFEFQAAGEPGEGALLAKRMRWLSRLGLGHFGYFPENPAEGLPELRELFPVFSLRDQPQAGK